MKVFQISCVLTAVVLATNIPLPTLASIPYINPRSPTFDTRKCAVLTQFTGSVDDMAVLLINKTCACSSSAYVCLAVHPCVVCQMVIEVWTNMPNAQGLIYRFATTHNFPSPVRNLVSGCAGLQPSTSSGQHGGYTGFYGFAGVRCKRCTTQSPQYGRVSGGVTSVGHKETISYQCNTNMTLVGEAQNECVSGKWRYDVPTCLWDCEDRTQHRDPSQSPIVKHGSTFSVSCQPGYFPSGDPKSATCQNGTFHPVNYAQCHKIPPGACFIPPDVHRVEPSRWVFSGSNVLFSCKSGYPMFGQPSTTCTNGEWTPALPTCGASHCHIEADLHRSHPTTQSINATVGETYLFACGQGYIHPNQKSFHSTCQTSGLMSPPVSKCYQIPAGSCFIPSDANRVQPSKWVMDGSTVPFSCKFGYTLHGERSPTCMNGQWSPAFPTCRVTTCHIPDDEHRVTPNPNAFEAPINASYVFTCSQWFHAQSFGTLSSTCGADGVMRPAIHPCTEIQTGSCYVPPGPYRNLGNGWVPNGHVLKFNCSQGYALNSTGTPQCVNGKFVPGVPSCQRIRCYLRPDPFRYSDKGGLYIPSGDSRVVQCVYGYTRQPYDDNFVFTCRQDGRFDHALGLCTPSCAIPESYAHRKLYMPVGTHYILHPCGPGMEYSGPSSLRCVAINTYSPPWPVCRPKLPCRVSAPQYGYMNTTSLIYVHDVVKYSCQTGYFMSGSAISVCNFNGNTTPPPPTCHLQPRCAILTIEPCLSNASVLLSMEVASFRCPQGYYLSGSNTTMCDRNGHLTSPLPTCQPLIPCNIQRPADGWANATRLLPGQVVEYRCPADDHFIGVHTATCYRNGTLSSPPPQCSVRKPCVIQTPDHGSTNLTSNQIVFPEAVKYTCGDLYDLVGIDTATCDWNGQLSSRPPFCQLKKCRIIPAILHGRVNVTRALIDVLTVIEYTCDVGYTLDGTRYQRCDPFIGVIPWVPPTCKVTTCAVPNPSNGLASTSLAHYSEDVTFSCSQTGYHLVGSSTLRCGASGKLVGSLPTCELMKCPVTNPQYGSASSNSITYGQSVVFSCDNGYLLDGSSTSTCTTTTGGDQVVLTTPTPRCIEYLSAQCHVNNPTNGRASLNVINFGEQVTFSCNSGFLLTSHSPSTCIGIDKLQIPPPQCVRPATCQVTAPTNGKMNSTASSITTNQVIKYSCNQMYSLSGSEFSTCGFDGVMHPPPPTCPITTCYVPDPPNGKVEKHILVYNEVMKNLHCDVGYVPHFDVTGGYPTCLDRGYLNGPTPTCVRRTCHLPPGHLRAVKSPVVYNDTAEFYCADAMHGERVFGSARATCLANGTFDLPLPVCKTCNPDSQAMSHAGNINWTSGVVTCRKDLKQGRYFWTCPQGYKCSRPGFPVPEVCENGVWKNFPTCQYDAVAYALANRAYPNGLTFDLESASVSCVNSKTHFVYYDCYWSNFSCAGGPWNRALTYYYDPRAVAHAWYHLPTCFPFDGVMRGGACSTTQVRREVAHWACKQQGWRLATNGEMLDIVRAPGRSNSPINSKTDNIAWTWGFGPQDLNAYFVSNANTFILQNANLRLNTKAFFVCKVP